ncbi:MAG TPA: DUF2231 domain-containing protein [Jatrophihabitans sp.]|jgi:uncharacterized membrane protein|nr:DUF2231 domain-containing protein [Jatrophihabitans sp.]
MEPIVGPIERARSLDGPAAGAQALVRTAVPDGPVAELLRGRPLGHPLHPAAVVLPIGAWTSAIAADLLREPAAARKLTALGCVTALPAALAGALDWATTDGAQRRVGAVHAVVNGSALVCFTLSWRARRRGRRVRGFLDSLAGAGLVTAGAWLGGHLAYSQGVGVDVTGFAARQRESEPA